MTDKKPANSNNVTPLLTVKDADRAIEFYKDVLGAKPEFRMDMPNGKVAHASMRIGDSEIMLGELQPDMRWSKETRASTYVYVDDPDAVFKKAIEKGAKAVMEPADMFYGDRTACFTDPFGQDWTVALHVEDVSEDEMKRRGQEMFSNKAA